jgi:hypothetical protein
MVEKKKKSPLKWIVIGSIVIFIIFAVILFLYKSNHTDFTTKNLILDIVVGVIVLGGIPLVSWFLINRDANLRNKLKKEISILPEGISREECREIRDREVLEQYENYLETPTFEDTPSIGIGGKSTIYICLARGMFDDPYASENYPNFFIAINTHYPDKKMSIIKDPTQPQIERVISRLSSSPEGEPDVEETMEENPLLGTRRTTKKVVHKPDKSKEKKPKEDLVEKEEEE